MQMIYFSATEGIQDENLNNGHLPSIPSGPWWTGFGPHQADPVGSPTSPSKPSKSDKEAVTQFAILAGDCKDLMPEQRLKLGFSQPEAMCAKYQNVDPCYGVLSAYEPHFPGSMMLPLKPSASEGLVIYVNPKQYPAIIRRRESRAKAEQDNRFPRVRKPYMHKSRHLHAKRRPRGCGGRFLNTKSCCNGKGQSGEKKSCEHHSSSSQSSEVLQPENRTLTSSRGGADSRESLSAHNELRSICSTRDSAVNHSSQPFHLYSVSDGKP